MKRVDRSPRAGWPRLPLAVCGFLLLAAVPSASAESGDADPEAAKLAERVLDAMGGHEAWAATRFIRFNFFGARTHHWDRYTGRHRYEGKTQEGETYVVLHNVNDRGQGTVIVNGETLTGDAEKDWLERAYGAWINDTYWLVMPYKLRDPGVNLEYAGKETIDGEVYETLKLTFEHVGLTPGDTYWAYVDPETGLMERWAYFLEGWEADREPTHWQWLDWDRYGGILLSSRRVNPADGREAMLSDIAVFDRLPDSVFDAPGPVTLD